MTDDESVELISGIFALDDGQTILPNHWRARTSMNGQTLLPNLCTLVDGQTVRRNHLLVD